MKAPSEGLNFPHCHSVNAISVFGSGIGVHKSDVNGPGRGSICANIGESDA